MKKILNILMLALIAIAAVAVVLWLVGGDVNGMTANVQPMLTVTYCFLALALVLLVALTLMNMGKSRGNSNLGLFVFGGLAIFAVAYFFAWASSTEIIGADGTVFSDEFTLKITDTMLWVTYAALVVTVIAMLWGVVRKALK